MRDVAVQYPSMARRSKVGGEREGKRKATRGKDLDIPNLTGRRRAAQKKINGKTWGVGKAAGAATARR